LIRDPQSEYAEEAKQRIEVLKQRIEENNQRALQTAQN
jgi:outer membrane protein assembly factor BamD (BamD/ComL family)